MTDQPLASDLPLINVVGDLTANIGISEAFRGHVRAMQHYSVPLHYTEIRLRLEHLTGQRNDIELPPAGRDGAINYIHLNFSLDFYVVHFSLAFID
ncbi:MAG: hypothetical protein AAF653_21320 [Chloroflexota bacterium]